MRGPETAARRGSYTVRGYEARDAPAALELLQSVFGGWPLEIEVASAADFFRWKHRESPFGPSALMVAEQDGAIIGFEAWQRWRLKAAGRTFEAMRAVDLVVAPEHRRRGIHTAFMRMAEKQFPGEGIAFTFSHPNLASRPGGIKAGRTPTAKMPIFVRLRPSALPGFSGARRRADPKATEAAGAALSDGDAVSELLARSWDPPDRLTTAKDLEYLRWKYGSLDPYRAIRIGGRGRLEGMAIFRVHRRGPRLAATICEVLVGPGDHRTARRLLRAVVRVAPADLVVSHLAPGSPARRAAPLCGFVPLPGRTPTTVMPLQPGLSPDPTRPDAWALDSGDLDLI